MTNLDQAKLVVLGAWHAVSLRARELYFRVTAAARRAIEDVIDRLVERFSRFDD